ncbi:transposase [Ancylostoma ceylanicum]|uniref:Transposase n=1 Tax=Ancylostoma ceylanicum TaxID=53326 RepID=A0A0D6LZL6_9BILA|nr:transposase [Ancylostoma ceylanicum]
MTATKSSIRERLLHEYQLGHSAAVGRRNVCATFGQDVLKKSTAEFWYKKLREGSTEVKEWHRAGRPRSMNRALVIEAIEGNPTFTTRILASSFHYSHTIVEKILCEAGFKVHQRKWVPHDLTPFQKQRRFECARDLLDRYRKQPFLDRIVTCDETWIAFDNRRMRKQGLRSCQKPTPVPKPSMSQQKVMLCVSWWIGGIIHWELVASGHIIDVETYCIQLQRVTK